MNRVDLILDEEDLALAPFLSSSLAVASPIPCAAPVISATFLDSIAC